MINSTDMYALVNCDVFTGSRVEFDKAVVIKDHLISAVVSTNEVPTGVELVDLHGQSVSPGFIDVQVNGGGGVLFNDKPTIGSIEAIAAAHRRFGTTDFLPTFITGDPAGMLQAAEAVRECRARSMPGILGIHFEGPFLCPEKAGVHDKEFVRPPSDRDLEIVGALADGVTLLTFAPEALSSELIAQLVQRGLRLSVGHTNATFAQTMKAFAAGATCTTHLFNAMSPFTSREPGVVGAALDDARSWVGIIADGHHVDYSAIRVAWRAKERRKMLLVTDAMPPVGSELPRFSLGQYEIESRQGRCVTPDGVLAGSALDMATAVRNCVQHVGIPKDEALRMASTYPAEFLGVGGRLGLIRPGHEANLAIFNNQIQVSAVVLAGEYIQSVSQ